MASGPERRRSAAWLAATALAAGGWWFGSGLHPQWWLTWLAPLPVLWLAPRVRHRWAAGAAFVAYAVGGGNQWHYLHGVIGLPMTTIAAAIGLPALAFALAVLLYRRLLSRRRALAASIAPAATWVAVEYVNNLLSPHGTFGSIAYSQMDALPVIQVAAVTGLWGVSFLLLLLPAALAVQALPPAVPARGRMAALATALVLLAAALGYGALRLRAPAAASVRIGLVSIEKPIRPALQGAAGQALEARYVQAIGRLAQQGARIAVIPETSFATADTVPAFAQLARQRGLVLDAGIDFKGGPQAEHNRSMVFPPGAGAPASYDKHHLIPGFERQYTPGRRYRMLDGTPRIGLAICKDMDFHDIGQAYAARGAQLLLVPAWDFGVDGWLHARMAIMRGVESGFAVVRAARSGRLTLSDDRGRVLAEASSERHGAELVGDLPLRDTRTLYARCGDAFAWLDLAGLAALLLLAMRPARRD